MKMWLLIGGSLFLAWVAASLSIRLIGVIFLGLRNSEMSVGVISILAAIAVAIWVWHRLRRSG